ncbi:beta-1,3-galactosyltransferase 1-like [Liolophura sinensis]|uniref:beta-1,3-galactosyltransferase 1-like n=1 Tax=Liolophura sinensis TaxID=3198878 RepID=UPI003158629B
MPSPQRTSKGGNRGINLETIFASLVVSACLCSLLIAHLSRPNVVYVATRKLQFKTAVPINSFQGGIHQVSLEADDPRPRHVIHDKIESEVASSGVLPWFKPVPSPSIAPGVQHPYFEGYIIENKDICKNQRVDILIYMHSEVSHFSSRTILRETWAGLNNFKDIRVKTVFFLGDAAHPEDGPGVGLEQSTYNDIVQGDFVDVFTNLGIKAVMVSQWISRHCAHARYVIKVDDNIFLDIFRVTELFIPQIWHSPTTLMCHFQKGESRKIQRDPHNRWYVPVHLLANKTYYPEFCSGYAILMTTDVMPILYQGSFKAPLIAVDDAFLFGLSAPTVKPLKYVDISRHLSLQQDVQLGEYTSGAPITHTACKVKDSAGYRSLWNATLNRLTDWALQHASVHVLKQRQSLERGT